MTDDEKTAINELVLKLERGMQARIDRVEGLTYAASAAIRGLILQSPDAPQAARAAAEQIEKVIAAGLQHTAASDALLDGLEKGRARVLPSARDL